MAGTRNNPGFVDHETRQKILNYIKEDYIVIAESEFEISNPAHRNYITLWVRGLITRRGKRLDLRISKRGKWTTHGMRLKVDDAIKLYQNMQEILPRLQAAEWRGLTSGAAVDLSVLVNNGDKIGD